jgi:hypothetical protein
MWVLMPVLDYGEQEPAMADEQDQFINLIQQHNLSLQKLWLS